MEKQPRKQGHWRSGGVRNCSGAYKGKDRQVSHLRKDDFRTVDQRANYIHACVSGEEVYYSDGHTQKVFQIHVNPVDFLPGLGFDGEFEPVRVKIQALQPSAGCRTGGSLPSGSAARVTNVTAVACNPLCTYGRSEFGSEKVRTVLSPSMNPSWVQIMDFGLSDIAEGATWAPTRDNPNICVGSVMFVDQNNNQAVCSIKLRFQLEVRTLIPSPSQARIITQFASGQQHLARSDRSDEIHPCNTHVFVKSLRKRLYRPSCNDEQQPSSN